MPGQKAILGSKKIRDVSIRRHSRNNLLKLSICYGKGLIKINLFLLKKQIVYCHVSIFTMQEKE